MTNDAQLPKDGPPLFKVGERFPLGTPPFPEGNQYSYTSGSHFLFLSFHAPTSGEIEAVQHGVAEYALVVRGDVIFLVYQLGRMPWQDAPFSFHLVSPEARQLPDPESTGHAFLFTTLVDAETGILRAMRSHTWSAEFTRAVETAIRAQAERPWCGADDFNRQIAETYSTFKDSKALALLAASHRTRGGA